LIRAGAMDCFGQDRAVLLASVAFAVEVADQAAASANQVSLFGGDDSDLVAPPEYVKATPWTDRQKLAEEKIALGYYLSGHMFDAFAGEVRRFAKTKLSALEPSREPRMLCGVITGVRTQMTQRGKILIVSLDDKTGVVEVTVYSELFEAHKNIFKEGVRHRGLAHPVRPQARDGHRLQPESGQAGRGAAAVPPPGRPAGKPAHQARRRGSHAAAGRRVARGPGR
jgi:DNA polymerase III alpha subunit